MKIWHLVTGPGVGAVLDGSFLGNLYLIEMTVGVILPLALLSLRSVRTSLERIFAVDILVILGVLMNRMNVAVFGVSEYATRSGGDYFPSFMEFSLSGGHDRICDPGVQVLRQIPAPVSRVASLNTRRHLSE